MQFGKSIGRMGLYEVDVSTLPVVHKDKRSLGTGIFLMVFALLWGGLPTLFLIRTILSGDFEPGMLFVLLFSIIGLALFVFGLKLVTTRRVIEISEETVHFTQRSLFGTKSWEEPLKNFKGVWSHSVYYSGGKNSSGYTAYKLELLHPDRKKRLRLYESRSPEGLRARQQNYCRKLQLPALEGDDEASLTVREVEDLGKSVGELAREGRIEVDFDPTQSPPAGVELAVEEDKLRITLPKSSNQCVGLLIGFVIGGVFAIIGFVVPDGPLLFGIVGVGIVLATIGGTIWSYITHPVVTVAPDHLHIAHMTPWGETKGTHMDADAIQNIRVGKRVKNQGSVALLVGKDDLPHAIGSGLPKDTLEWLRNCVLAVVARGAQGQEAG